MAPGQDGHFRPQESPLGLGPPQPITQMRRPRSVTGPGQGVAECQDRDRGRPEMWKQLQRWVWGP